MRGLLYIFTTSMKNKIKRYAKKPLTYVWIIGAIAYFYMIFKGFGPMIEGMGIGTPEGFATVVSFGIFMILPANIITYAKRKGLIFRTSDVHFVFSAPVNPKLVLLNSQSKMIFMSMLINFAIVTAGVIYFHVPVLNAAAYFCLAFIVENILESSIVVILYGNERLSERHIKLFCRLLYGLIGLLLAFGVYLFLKYEASWNIISIFINHPVVRCVPIIGWNIAFLKLIIVGPDMLNIICTALFCLSAAGLFMIAYRMKCTGEYYESAMNFADNYEVRLAKGKKGEVAFPGKKKFGKATVEYKGTYAKAIFYRQLLEYKKNRFFIFGMASVFCLAAGIAIGIFGYFNGDEIGPFKVFIVPGVSAYITFIFSGYATKWSKEAANPYTFLIPDTPARKLWYATLIEHLRAIVDGALITIPAAVTLKLNIIQIILCIGIYFCLQANKLYLSIVAEAIVVKFIGSVGMQLFKMFAQATFIGLAAMSAVVGGMFLGAEAGYVLLIVTAGAITAIMAIIGSSVFAKMESVG